MRSPLVAAGKATLRTWITASALVIGPAAVADLLSAAARPAAITVVWALGIALAMAALNGALWFLAFKLVRRFPAYSTWLLWPAAAIGLGGWLANDLGAYAKLGGKDHKLAVIALVACGAGGLGAGVLVALLQPRMRAPRGLLAQRKPWLRALLVLGMGGAAIAATVVDRRFFPGTYPGAHMVLRVGSLWLGMWALVTTGVRIGPPPLHRRRWIGAAAYALVALFPFATLTEGNATAIHDLLEQPLTGLLFRAARDVTDVDLDGYSSLLGGGDCAPYNPWISPGAPEIPGNGIDDNCRLGDAKLVDRVSDQAQTPVPKDPSPMSVLLVTIDTLRADRLSLYGFSRDTTPNLVKIGRSSVRFDCAITAGGWTSISISSIMRGMYPRRLLWSPLVETSKYRLLRYPLEEELEDGESLRLGFALPLDDPLIPMARWLQRRGMYTAAVVDDGYSEFLAAEFTSNGFDRYVEVNPGGSGGHNGDEETANMAIQALSEAPKDRPFFLWVHFFGPHEPNTSHPGLPVWGKNEVDGYDQEIRFADMQVERVVEALDKSGRQAATIITSDHGETIRNTHDRDHGSELMPEILWVPLLLRGPGLTGGTTVSTPVSLVDILPTVLGLTRTPAPQDLDGIDLRKAIAHDPASLGRILHSDTWRMNLDRTFTPDVSSTSDTKHTFIIDLNDRASAVRTVCDRTMSLTNLEGKVPTKHLEDSLYQYEEETGGAPRLAKRPKRPPAPDPFADPSMW